MAVLAIPESRQPTLGNSHQSRPGCWRRSIPLRQGKGIPYGLVGALVLIWAFEGFISRHPLECTDDMANIWRLSRQAAQGAQARADVLCFGDSLVKVGIVPRVLEKRLGRSAFNLALFAGHSSSSFILLRHVIESGARPQAIVIDFHSNLLAAATKTNGPYWTKISDLRDACELCWQTLDPCLVLKIAGAWLLPSCNGRVQIREVVLSALRGETPLPLRSRQALARNWSVNRGAFVLSKVSPRADESLLGQNLPNQWRARPVNVRYLEKLLDLAAAHQVPVFWVLPPARPEWQASREKRGFDAAFVRFIQSIERRYDNFVVVDGRHSGYEASLFIDGTHLNSGGAQSLSSGLAEVMARYLGPAPPPSRWARLPAYSPAPADSRVEDFEQSLLALRAREGGRF